MSKDELKCRLLFAATVVVGIMAAAALIWLVGIMVESLLDYAEGEMVPVSKVAIGAAACGGGLCLFGILSDELAWRLRRMSVDSRLSSPEGGKASGAGAVEREERSMGGFGSRDRERPAAFSDEIVDLVAFARACDGASPEIARACRDRAALLAGRRVVEEAERRGGPGPDAACAPLVGGGESCGNGRLVASARVRMARRKAARRRSPVRPTVSRAARDEGRPVDATAPPPRATGAASARAARGGSSGAAGAGSGGIAAGSAKGALAVAAIMASAAAVAFVATYAVQTAALSSACGPDEIRPTCLALSFLASGAAVWSAATWLGSCYPQIAVVDAAMAAMLLFATWCYGPSAAPFVEAMAVFVSFLTGAAAGGFGKAAVRKVPGWRYFI